jgi:diguanylate cyclase (GGDEF)-like protein
LILCDIDHFKRYNDTHGHQQGDECLRSVARTIAGSIRRPADVAARYGGEEFALILPNTHAEGAMHIAETIRNAVQALEIPHPASPSGSQVTLSLGVACIVPSAEGSPDKLLAAADQALYAAKGQGRNRSIFLQI